MRTLSISLLSLNLAACAAPAINRAEVDFVDLYNLKIKTESIAGPGSMTDLVHIRLGTLAKTAEAEAAKLEGDSQSANRLALRRVAVLALWQSGHMAQRAWPGTNVDSLATRALSDCKIVSAPRDCLVIELAPTLSAIDMNSLKLQNEEASLNPNRDLDAALHDRLIEQRSSALNSFAELISKRPMPGNADLDPNVFQWIDRQIFSAHCAAEKSGRILGDTKYPAKAPEKATASMLPRHSDQCRHAMYSAMMAEDIARRISLSALFGQVKCQNSLETYQSWQGTAAINFSPQPKPEYLKLQGCE